MGIQREQRITSFPAEVRDYNVEKCARWSSDFFNVGDFVSVTGGSPLGVVEYGADYSTPNQSAGVARLNVPVTAAAGTRARIADADAFPTLAFGLAEMDLLWRGYMTIGTPNAGDVYARIGFCDARAAAQSAATTDDGIVFDRAPGETTWQASVYKDSATVVRKDTGIPVTSFATFGIWCSQDGRKVVMSANDVVRHVETTGISASASLRACMDIQATGTVTAAYSLRADYMQFRFFPRRS
jgi:hypothetical protein